MWADVEPRSHGLDTSDRTSFFNRARHLKLFCVNKDFVRKMPLLERADLNLQRSRTNWCSNEVPLLAHRALQLPQNLPSNWINLKQRSKPSHFQLSNKTLYLIEINLTVNLLHFWPQTARMLLSILIKCIKLQITRMNSGTLKHN